MKNMSAMFVVGAVILLFASFIPASAAPASPDSRAFLSRYSYNPVVVYAGKCDANVLYYHNLRNPNWYRGFRKELDSVTCPSAIAGFRSSGTWKGHLSKDGSCGDPAEPVEWALGNRLNFDGVVPHSGK